MLKTEFLAFFNRVKNAYLVIFLPNSIVTGMPYLPAKDEVVSLNPFSSRGLWKWYNSKPGLAISKRRLYGVNTAFHYLPVFSKKKILWKIKIFHCDFRTCFTKGFFLTKYEEFRIFSFDGEFSIFTNSRSLNCGKYKLNILRVIVCKIRTSAWHGTPSIWLIFGM